MAVLTVNSISKAGIVDIDADLVSADVAGDSVNSSSGLMVVMKNADASLHTLTVASPTASVNCGGYGSLDVDPIVLSVAAGDVGFLSIPSAYVDGNGDFSWTYDAVTSVTIGVFSIAP